MKTEPQRNHERAPGMVQTSIAIPKPLLEALDVLARQEERSRNKIITMLLREQVAKYDATRNKEVKT